MGKILLLKFGLYINKIDKKISTCYSFIMKKKNNQTAEKINTFSYTVTKFDSNGWAKAKDSLPIPYDLVTALTNTDKKINAWWNERNWDGYRLKDKDVIIKWKRKLHEHICQ